MNKFNSTAIVAAIALAFSAGAMATSMSKDDYKAGKTSIATDYKSAKAGCDSLSANAKDVCMAEAKGKENVAKAELEAGYKPSAKTHYDVSIAKAKADYAVAKEKCDDKAGNDKDVCVKEAKSAQTAAKADAKAQVKVAAVRKDAAEDKRDAEYAVAKEKCDALVGDTKGLCIKDAKAHYGKS
jgi:hypothetical protein